MCKVTTGALYNLNLMQSVVCCDLTLGISTGSHIAESDYGGAILVILDL